MNGKNIALLLGLLVAGTLAIGCGDKTTETTNVEAPAAEEAAPAAEMPAEEAAPAAEMPAEEAPAAEAHH